MQRNNGGMNSIFNKRQPFESSATVEPRQRISNIYIYLYVSSQSVFIGSEDRLTMENILIDLFYHKSKVLANIHTKRK